MNLGLKEVSESYSRRFRCMTANCDLPFITGCCSMGARLDFGVAEGVRIQHSGCSQYVSGEVVFVN